MAEEKKADRGRLEVDSDECKGCGLCIEACPPKVILLNERLNHYGYRTAMYAGSGCTACGICFMVCPEPGAITVLRLVSADSHPLRDKTAEKDGASSAEVSGSHPFRSPEPTESMGHASPAEGGIECASN